MFVDINYNYNFSQEGNGFRYSVFFFTERNVIEPIIAGQKLSTIKFCRIYF